MRTGPRERDPRDRFFEKVSPDFVPVEERTHCGNGHPRTLENTYIDPKKGQLIGYCLGAAGLIWRAA